MKFTKKMIMVPESEYQTLMAMLKGSGGDHLQNERTQTDVRLKKTLTDPKLTEEARSHKYNWLYKKRRQLKAAVENRPQKVVIEPTPGAAAAASNVPPYIAPVTSTPKIAKKPASSVTSTPMGSAYESAAEKTEDKTLRPRRKVTPSKSAAFRAIMQKEKAGEMEALITRNMDKFRVNEDGKFESNIKGRTIRDSDFRQVIDYLIGDRNSPPRGFRFLLERLGKDPDTRALIYPTSSSGSSGSSSSSGEGSGEAQSQEYITGDQQGYGKRRRRHHVIAKAPTKITSKSTKGLKRERTSFRPILWEKLE
jgi:hypothetical protein